MKNVKRLLGEIDKVYDCDLNKTRFGNKHDGGYVALYEICKMVKEVYTFGVGDDIGFEIDFLQSFPNTKMKFFDPTINNLPANSDKRMQFHKYSVVRAYDELATASNNSLLKMDIEWNEWEAFFLLSNDILNKFSQIIVEFHVVHTEVRKGLSPYFGLLYQNIFDKVNDELFDSYYETLKKLNNLFYIFHIHPNNSLPKVEVDGYKFPPLIELSFIRKDLAGVVRSAVSTFPIEGLDFPNKTDREDIVNFYPLGVKHIKV